MKILPLLSIALLISVPGWCDSYTLYREKDKMGIKDGSGKVIIPAAFDGLGWSDGSFSVVSGVTGYKLNEHWGLINLRKELLSKPDFEGLTCSGGDRIVARKKINAIQSAIGCLNLKGETVIPFIYDGIALSGLRAVVFTRQNARYVYGIVDLNGKEILPLLYADIRPLGTLRYAVENDVHKTALFSDDGKPITDFSIDSISAFHGGIAIVFKDQYQGAINRDGQLLAETIYRQVKVDESANVLVQLPAAWRALTSDNKLIREIEGDQLIPLGKNLYHVARGNLHGVVDHEFKTILPIRYGFLGQLENDKLVAAKDGKFGIIRLDGSEVIPLKFDSLILEGRTARVRTDVMGKSSWTLIDTFGIRKTQKEFDKLEAFNTKFFPAMKNGFWGGVDRYGQSIIQCVFDSLLQVMGDKIAVKFRGAYGIIDTSENWIVAPQSLRLILRKEERYSVRSGNVIFLKDFSGRDIYFTENEIEFQEDAMKEISADGSEKMIDYSGRIIHRSLPPMVENTEQVFPESEGLRGIKKDGKFGFVDSRGRLRIANRYDDIGIFREGLAAVKLLGKWGYINSSEGIVIQPVYDKVSAFSNGKALVTRSGKAGVIDNDGKILLPLRYDSIRIMDGYFLLKADALAGLADERGTLLLDTKYDEIENLKNGFCLIHRNRKAGLLTLQGLSTIPLAYDQLIYDHAKNEYLGLIASGWKKIEMR